MPGPYAVLSSVPDVIGICLPVNSNVKFAGKTIADAGLPEWCKVAFIQRKNIHDEWETMRPSSSKTLLEEDRLTIFLPPDRVDDLRRSSRCEQKMRRDVLSLIVGWTMLAMLIPLSFSFLVTWWLDGFNTASVSFLIPLFFSGFIGLALLSIGVRSDTTERLRDREAFAAVALAWPVAVLVGSLPFWLGGVFHGPFTDGSTMSDIGRGFVNSWFESMSGFTTTGATVIEHSMSPNCIPGSTPDCINAQPKGILIWRSLTQWLGGMGIIMLGLMLLSRVLGGGMALARAELTGPSLSRLRPKLQETALALWTIYIILTVIEIILLWFLGGMTMFDAFNHGLTTMPSGGFSTHDASIAYYDSFVVESIIICFMFLAGVNFTLIWLAWEKQWDKVFADQEGRSYVLVITATTLFVFIALMSQEVVLMRDSLILYSQ